MINIQITEEEHKKFSRTKLKYLQISMDKQEIPEQIVVNMMMIPQFTTSEGAYLAFNQLEKSVSPQSWLSTFVLDMVHPCGVVILYQNNKMFYIVKWGNNLVE